MINVIIPAGGKSERYSKTTSKLDELIHGTSILKRSIEAFINHKHIQNIVIAYPKNEQKKYESLALEAGPTVSITPGGETRAHSVYNAFKTLSDNNHILIHDAARPNPSQTLIQSIIDSLEHHPVVIPGLTITDTIKKVSNNQITETINREALVAVQTPQGFHFNALHDAYESITDFSMVTDEAKLLEMNGIYGTIVPGEKENIKITHPIDLTVLSSLIKA
ncbi:2-C-methyl-D-erythritol 4-phosphate cytidylyltransferase [Candidatus Marinamargulisbacteria bacterium SCGC AG-343-K17]|nr:2-C-methyl-D-erythritol 4-phosphate cytidylyltransferase [Candidatus Marinamargulisbacteria bacterium SCGC AG-343-K17]